jgi:hypothetical protein
VPVGFPQRFGRFPQRVVLAKLVRDPRKDLGDRQPDRLLRVADYAEHRQPRGLDRLQQPREVGSGRLLQVGRPQDRPAEYLAHDPELLVPLLRLQPIERQNESAVLRDGRR